MTQIIVALVSGLLFGAGLAIGHMTDPNVILGFLDVAGEWNPLLLILFVSALVSAFVGYKLTFLRKRPLFAENFSLPTRKDIDKRLIVGSAIFGIGWGLGGFCPGPALSALSGGAQSTAIFVIAMLAGIIAMRFIAARKG